MKLTRTLNAALWLTSAVCVTLTVGAAWAAPSATLAPRVQTYLEQHCLKCHGAEAKKDDFRIDTLSAKVGFEDTPQWLEIMEQINSGEMPPEEVKQRPMAEESAQVVEWIAARMK